MTKYNIFIPKYSRACPTHNVADIWSNATIGMYNNYSIEQIEDMLQLLLDKKVRSATTNTPIETDDDIQRLIGLNEDQFECLYLMLSSLHAKYLGREKTARCALKAYLMRLRTSNTYEQISRHLGITRLTLRKMLENARNSLVEDIVSQYLGFENISRDDLLSNNTTMAQKLLCEDNDQKVVTIWDGTYIFCNKSINQHIQRTTYSGQKSRNLVKPMVCVTPNGYYVDIFGPYGATKNDATIMSHVMENHSAAIFNKLRAGDVIVLDRGFRDCQNMLESKGLVVKMPEFVRKDDNTSQLTTAKANRSRLVTANRFVIETRNGNIKSIWKSFDTRWNAYDLSHMMEDYRIGATLINLFYNKIIPNSTDAEEIATTMLQRLEHANKLSKIVQTNQFQRQIKHFEEGDVDTVIFPRLNYEDLKKISLGNYQVAQMNPYVVEHLRSNEDQFKFYVAPQPIVSMFFRDIISSQNIENPILLLTILRSRFRNSGKYQTFVLADQAKNGIEGIIEYCCDCKHGLRTVGCCSHVMCMTGYLGVLKHNPEKIHEASKFLIGKFI